MKTRSIIRYLGLICLIVNVAVGHAHGATYTWSGAGGDDSWITKQNWGTANDLTASDIFVFSGSTRLSPFNGSDLGIAGFRFASNAGAFVISGSTLVLGGSITNDSDTEQVIKNNIQITANRTIDTGKRGIEIEGAISQDASVRGLSKIGTGSLTLSGSNSYTGNTLINEGKLILNVEKGGMLAAAGTIRFGEGTSTTVFSSINQGGAFEVLGRTSGATAVQISVLYLSYPSGDNRIKVDSNGGTGTTLQFDSMSRNNNSEKGFPTLHIDLSSPGSVVKLLGTIPSLLNGVTPYATVTFGDKTGFLNVDGNSNVIKATTTPLAASGNATSGNFRTSGLQLTASASIGTLTLTGSGAITVSNPAFNLQPKAILMEEGVGDFSIKAGSIGLNNAEIYIHQHSTVGVLTLDGGLGVAGNRKHNNAVVKTGSGAVIYKGDAVNLGGVTDIQEGRFELQGKLGATVAVQVRSGATLAGSGTIGGGAWTKYVDPADVVQPGPRYTLVNVYSGGTLEATNSQANALKITGSLTLDKGSTFIELCVIE